MAFNLKEFQSEAQYDAYMAGDPILPGVSHIVDGNGVHYDPMVVRYKVEYIDSVNVIDTRYFEVGDAITFPSFNAVGFTGWSTNVDGVDYKYNKEGYWETAELFMPSQNVVFHADIQK